MNSNTLSGTPFKKRNNPMESKPVSEPQQTVVEPQAYTAPVQVEKPRQTVAPRRSVPSFQQEQNRIKYTATMDVDLHKRVKVAAAMSGFQISSFIEEAIIEKLNKEGF